MIGFNEAVNDATVYNLLTDNKQQLEKIGIPSGEAWGPIYNYMQYMPVLNAIGKNILKYKGITEEFAGYEIFKKWERGQFERTALVLKDIELACGKGSLEILSYLGVLDDPKKCEELDGMIQNYFEEEDVDKRDTMGQRIKAFFESNQGDAFKK